MRVTGTTALAVLTIVAALGWPAGAEAQQLRGAQATSRRLIADGLARSAIIRGLAQRIERSDIVVYVDTRRDMPSHVVGSMRFVARTATHRVVRISLNQDYSWPTRLAYLGHELQHACELAAVAHVDSAARMRAYYRQFGVRVDRDAYDTREAQAITRRVQAELRGKTSETEHIAMIRAGAFEAPGPRD